LYNNFRLYPFMPRTNADSGSTAFGLGGLTANEMTLVNGPTWGASGLAFASASSQYGSISDFLGSETLTVFARTTNGTLADGAAVVSQYDTGANDRGWMYYKSTIGSRMWFSESVDGTAVYRLVGGDESTSTDICHVCQYASDGVISNWLNKTSQTLSPSLGSQPASRHDSSVAVLLNAFQSSGTPTSFANQTAHALAFLTGTLTTTQRETITDLINLIGSPPPLEALREYVAETGATDTLTLDRLTRYVSDEGLWDNFALYSMMPDTNYNSGSSVKVLGGLTSNDMTLVNGPTWGSSGLAFASASSQHGRISDFLGSETLTVFARTTKTNETSAGLKSIVAQYDTGADKRSFIFAQNGSRTNDPVILARDSVGDGSGAEAYEDGYADFGADKCLVTEWAGLGGLSYWADKTSRSLSLYAGSAQTSRANVDVDITLSCFLTSGVATGFADQTAHALAFVTGTVTTAQRETITDLINEL
jgi:hypothetical protein